MITKIDDRGRFFLSKKVFNNKNYILNYDLNESTITLSPISTSPHHH